MRQPTSSIPKTWLSLVIVAGLSLGACSPSPQETAPTQAAGLDAPSSAAATEAPAATEPPAPAGMDASNPAPRDETITSADFEFTVLEVLRGEEALAKLEEASAFNGPPEDEAMEYVLVRMRVRYVGASTEGLSVDPAFFDSAGGDGTLYDRPSITDVRNPEPFLQAELLPGGQVEGWVTVLSPKGDTGAMLVIQPRINGMSTGQGDVRYILLGP